MEMHKTFSILLIFFYQYSKQHKLQLFVWNIQLIAVIKAQKLFLYQIKLNKIVLNFILSYKNSITFQIPKIFTL
jgi:hypothetical protein